MDQFGDLSRLGEDDGPVTALDARNKELGRRKIGACVGIKKQKMLAGPGGAGRLHNANLFSNKAFPKILWVAHGCGQKNKLGGCAIAVAKPF